MQAHSRPTAPSPRAPPARGASSTINQDCHITTSVATAAVPDSRQMLAMAAAAAAAAGARHHDQRLLPRRPSHDPPGDHERLVHAYTLALRQAQSPGRLDVGACFVAHIRLAQLSFANNENNSANNSSCSSSSRGVEHLEAAWNLRDHLPPPLLRRGGALSFYFRAVGLKLAALYDEQDGDALQQLGRTKNQRRSQGGGSSGQVPGTSFGVDVGTDTNNNNGSRSERSLDVLRCVADLGVVVPRAERGGGIWADVAQCGKDDDANARGGAVNGATAAVKGDGGNGAEGSCGLVCDGCGGTNSSGGDVKTAGSAAAAAAAGLVVMAERRRDRGGGGGWYCLGCTEACDKAVAQGPLNDGTPCAGCDDRTQPVTIEPDGAWYCEACIEEFHEEQAEAEGRGDVLDDREPGGKVLSTVDSETSAEEAGGEGSSVDVEEEANGKVAFVTQSEKPADKAPQGARVDAKEAGGELVFATESETPAEKAGGAACGGQTAPSSAVGSGDVRSRDWAISC